MILRWVSAAVLDASERFRRVRGYRELEDLILALRQIENEQKENSDAQVA